MLHFLYALHRWSPSITSKFHLAIYLLEYILLTLYLILSQFPCMHIYTCYHVALWILLSPLWIWIVVMVRALRMEILYYMFVETSYWILVSYGYRWVYDDGYIVDVVEHVGVGNLCLCWSWKFCILLELWLRALVSFFLNIWLIFGSLLERVDICKLCFI